MFMSIVVHKGHAACPWQRSSHDRYRTVSIEIFPKLKREPCRGCGSAVCGRGVMWEPVQQLALLLHWSMGFMALVLLVNQDHAFVFLARCSILGSPLALSWSHLSPPWVSTKDFPTPDPALTASPLLSRVCKSARAFVLVSLHGEVPPSMLSPDLLPLRPWENQARQQVPPPCLSSCLHGTRSGHRISLFAALAGRWSRLQIASCSWELALLALQVPDSGLSCHRVWLLSGT
jgi:hypothetical protein